MKKEIFFGICLLLFNFCNAQYSWTEGELFLKDGTILKGQIKIPTPGNVDVIALITKERVKFRKEKKSDKIKYGEEQVEKIVFKDLDSMHGHFEYQLVSKKKKKIVRVLHRGKINVFSKRVVITGGSSNMQTAIPSVPFNTNSDEFYVSREGDAYVTLIKSRKPLSRSFKKNAMRFFKDCPSLVLKLKNKEYTEQDILQIVKEYENCSQT
ncbi:hypothetical protein [Ascidiimonas aurantiaca]|uniref:hypothetical protein n=1 Tax=Ascidiimonas aurantiaca TaxID=1685432 RepID=UPI0030EE36F9